MFDIKKSADPLMALTVFLLFFAINYVSLETLRFNKITSNEEETLDIIILLLDKALKSIDNRILC